MWKQKALKYLLGGRFTYGYGINVLVSYYIVKYLLSSEGEVFENKSDVRPDYFSILYLIEKITVKF